MKILLDIPEELLWMGCDKWVKVADKRYMRVFSFLEKTVGKKYPLFCSPVANYFLTEADEANKEEMEKVFMEALEANGIKIDRFKNEGGNE